MTVEEGESEVDQAVSAELREGAAVYTAICSSCHQPGGAGLSGQFPPLINNPNVRRRCLRRRGHQQRTSRRDRG